MPSRTIRKKFRHVIEEALTYGTDCSKIPVNLAEARLALTLHNEHITTQNLTLSKKTSCIEKGLVGDQELRTTIKKMVEKCNVVQVEADELRSKLDITKNTLHSVRENLSGFQSGVRTAISSLKLN